MYKKDEDEDEEAGKYNRMDLMDWLVWYYLKGKWDFNRLFFFLKTIYLLFFLGKLGYCLCSRAGQGRVGVVVYVRLVKKGGVRPVFLKVPM